jgi:hypothetical protein
MFSRFYVATALAVCCAFAAGCHGIVDPSTNTTQTFTGTIPVGGQYVQGFQAGNTGEIDIKVTQLTPSSSNTFIGVAYTGRANDGTCTGQLGTLYAQNSLGQVGFSAVSTRITAGGYCLLLYDVGTFTTTETFTATVSHP